MIFTESDGADIGSADAERRPRRYRFTDQADRIGAHGGACRTADMALRARGQQNASRLLRVGTAKGLVKSVANGLQGHFAMPGNGIAGGLEATNVQPTASSRTVQARTAIPTGRNNPRVSGV
jgi:hypothetical protein